MESGEHIIWDLRRIVVLAVLVGGSLALFRAAFDAAGPGRADLVVANGPEPQSLDPALATALPEGRILSCLFEGLVVPDPRSGAASPGLAASWDRSEDQRRWRFTLRPGIQWSDGEPIRAETVRWSFLRLLAPDTGAPNAYLLWDVKGARAFTRGQVPEAQVGIFAEGPDRVVFELERSVPHFLEILALPSFAPVPRHVVERHGAAWVHPDHVVSSGAFVLRFRRLRDRIRMVRNERYWDARAVALDTLDLLSVENASTMLNLYLTGAVDWITDVPRSAVPELLRRLGPEGTGEFTPTLRLGTYYYRLACNRPGLGDARVRRALSLAIDREAIVRDITRAGEVATHSFVPPGVRDYDPPVRVTHDPDTARRLFAEGLRAQGLERLPPLEILFNTSGEHQAIAELVQHQWQEVLGVETRLANQDWGSFQGAIRSGDFVVARSSWFGDYNDASSFLDLWITDGANNCTGFSSAEYDRLVREEAPRTREPAVRARLYHQAETLLLEAAPIIPIYHYVTTNIVSPRIAGFHCNPLDLHPFKHLGVKDETR